jgi:acid phosphatase family membrane protein YuiD
MSTVTFDTLKFVKTLEAGGMQPEQAEAIATAYRDASNDQELVTKKDLQVELAPMKVMMGVVMGGVIALIMKAFF